MSKKDFSRSPNEMEHFSPTHISECSQKKHIMDIAFCLDKYWKQEDSIDSGLDCSRGSSSSQEANSQSASLPSQDGSCSSQGEDE